MPKLMTVIPGMAQMTKKLDLSEGDVERQMAEMSAIYNSMTAAERTEPALLDAMRRRRIARGAGVGLNAVGQFMRQFEMSRDLMRAVAARRGVARLKLVSALVTGDWKNRD